MTDEFRLRSAAAFSSAFRVPPDIVEETTPATEHAAGNVGLYGWKTPRMDGFELPESDELIIALHLGGSRRVRAVTDQGLSRSCSMPGLVTVLPPGRSAAFRTEGSISLVSLHVPLALAAQLSMPLHASANVPWLPRFAFRDPYVSASMEALLRTARLGQRVRSDYVVKVVDAMLCHLAQWRQSPDDGGGGVLSTATPEARIGRISLRELFALIDAQLGRALNLDELARCTGLGRATFTRSFRQATGMSAHQAISLRRIEVARKLLAETDLDLAFVAQETGWCSQSHFTASFRKVVGCTPARYRALR